MWKIVLALIITLASIVSLYSKDFNFSESFRGFTVIIKCIEGTQYMFVTYQKGFAGDTEGVNVIQMLDKNGKPIECK